MPDHADPRNRTSSIDSEHLAWLSRELERWRADGIISDTQAAWILRRYRVGGHGDIGDIGRDFGTGLGAKASLARLLLGLGATFVGFGLIWLVAANIDELPPLVRWGAVAGIWLALLVSAELIAVRTAHRSRSPVVGAIRLLATLAFGALIFQAAQSMQVPAYQPHLAGLWAAGALTYGYAMRSTAAHVVGILALTGAAIWQILWEGPTWLGVVLGLLSAGVTAVSWAAIEERWRYRFAESWREAGAALLLIGLFVAAVPAAHQDGDPWSASLIVSLVVAGLFLIAGVGFGCGRARWEPAAAALGAGVAVALVLWDGGADPDRVGPATWAHAGLAVTAYAVAATSVAALGAIRGSWRLTAFAMVGLIGFTTFQSFAVFARIIEGAWLFVALGAIMIATGYLFDRARRAIAESFDDAGTEIDEQGDSA
ncbi:MAG: DUF2157 domain-containing protein [Nocardioides sp.]